MTGAVAQLSTRVQPDRKKQAAAGKKQAALFSWKKAAEQTKKVLLEAAGA